MKALKVLFWVGAAAIVVGYNALHYMALWNMATR